MPLTLLWSLLIRLSIFFSLSFLPFFLNSVKVCDVIIFSAAVFSDFFPNLSPVFVNGLGNLTEINYIQVISMQHVDFFFCQFHFVLCSGISASLSLPDPLTWERSVARPYLFCLSEGDGPAPKQYCFFSQLYFSQQSFYGNSPESSLLAKVLSTLEFYQQKHVYLSRFRHRKVSSSPAGAQHSPNTPLLWWYLRSSDCAGSFYMASVIHSKRFTDPELSLLFLSFSSSSFLANAFFPHSHSTHA